MYLTDDGRIGTCTSSIPIMGFIDIADISEDNICDVSYELKNIFVKPMNVEEHSVQVEIEIEASCVVYRKDEIKYKIDTVCQMSMYKNEHKEQTWDIILDLQRELYEKFDITDD